jgi:hypothetical protein
VLRRGHGQVVSAENVVLDGFENVRFHQGSVFVGRGVIAGRRRVLAQDFVFEERGFGDFKSGDAGP